MCDDCSEPASDPQWIVGAVHLDERHRLHLQRIAGCRLVHCIRGRGAALLVVVRTLEEGVGFVARTQSLRCPDCDPRRCQDCPTSRYREEREEKGRREERRGLSMASGSDNY